MGYNRRKFLNVIMSNVRFILEDVFPGYFLSGKNYNTYNNFKIIQPIDIGEGVNDDILKKLVKHVRTLPEQKYKEGYVPGLLVVDMGFKKAHLKLTGNDIDDDVTDEDHGLNELNDIYQALSINFEENIYIQNRNKEGHCAFFNAAHAIFSDRKHYLLLRYIVSMFYNILSKIKIIEMNTCCLSWIAEELFFDIPKRLAEFYFNDNLAIENTVDNYEKTLLANVKDLFGFDSIDNVEDYNEKMFKGTPYEQKMILHKLAICYIQPNFYGNASTFNVLGQLFGVRFGVTQAYAKTKASHITLDQKNNVLVQDFGINYVTMGCNFDFVLPFFEEDNRLRNKSYECYEFWLALTAGNNHYVHFLDSNSEERHGPINNLNDLTSSVWNSCISKFLLMSRNYQQATIIQDDSLSWEQIFYNSKRQFVFNKPILFRNMQNDFLKMNIKEPFDCKLSVNDNLENFIQCLPGDLRNKTVKCIDVSKQELFQNEKTWDEILDMHKIKPKDRNKTCYNQVSFCLAKTKTIKDSLEQPEFVKSIDWIDRYYPIEERNDDNQSFDYPRTQKVMLTSTRHSWMDMHLDYGGAAVWYHVFKGQKEFLIIEPTDEIIKLHIDHITKVETDIKRRGRKRKGKKKGKEKNEGTMKTLPTWFADKVCHLYPEKIYWVTIREGETIVFPCGFFHCVYTHLDTIAFAGSYFYDEAIPKSLFIHQEIEIFDEHASLFPFYRPLFVRALYDFCSNYKTKHNKNKENILMMITYCRLWINDKTNVEFDISQEIDKILKDTNYDNFMEWLDYAANIISNIIISDVSVTNNTNNEVTTVVKDRDNITNVIDTKKKDFTPFHV